MDATSDKTSKNSLLWWTMGFVWEVFMMIAIPTAFLALAGRWLDERWHTSPLFVILGLVLSLGIVYLLMKRQTDKLNAYFKARTKTVCPPCPPCSVTDHDLNS